VGTTIHLEGCLPINVHESLGDIEDMMMSAEEDDMHTGFLSLTRDSDGAEISVSMPHIVMMEPS
jgi:hypothetical protein